MRRTLLSCACLAVLMLPAAATARVHVHTKPGFLVVRRGANDGGVNGPAVVTLVVQGFVLGHVSQEARVDFFQLPSATGRGTPQVVGADVSHASIRWHRLTGREYTGSNFRFRALGGAYRLVVRGSGLYLFAGGSGNVRLRGSSVYRHGDGTYSLDGGRFRSLPGQTLKRTIGRG